jgi:hypothetical protein
MTLITSNDPNLQSVTARIGLSVIAFINLRLSSGDIEFTADALRAYVITKLEGVRVSPGSPDRVLRALRQSNKVNYIVVNRSKSLYRAIPVSSAVAV